MCHLLSALSIILLDRRPKQPSGEDLVYFPNLEKSHRLCKRAALMYRISGTPTIACSDPSTQRLALLVVSKGWIPILIQPSLLCLYLCLSLPLVSKFPKSSIQSSASPTSDNFFLNHSYCILHKRSPHLLDRRNRLHDQGHDRSCDGSSEHCRPHIWRLLLQCTSLVAIRWQ